MANPNWKKGVSGNPNGRKPKGRALTDILEAEGNKTVELSDGKHIARKRLMARHLWQAVEQGKISLPNGETIVVGSDDWFAIAQFLYKHIDGAPVQKIAPTTPDGENPYMSIETAELIELARKVADAGNPAD